MKNIIFGIIKAMFILGYEGSVAQWLFEKDNILIVFGEILLDLTLKSYIITPSPSE